MTLKHDDLKSELCFLFYVASKEVIKKYATHLKSYDLTYTSYITLKSIQPDEVVNIKTLGNRIYLNSGTLTPLIKKLDQKGLVQKVRDEEDERNLNISLTNEGLEVQQYLHKVTEEVYKELKFEGDDMEQLISILERFIKNNFE
ncbi:MarR family winged helix-turn-helix transcriptional regulator [Staphylococcus chromogenes]|uniref:MarR family winged helix-turn-helix transcriptional regulator n=1 Tax=Staphylococcus chromogenes TaxID=46126 RepID=UPI000D1AEE97|nr:MarR family transcriptional regulator [Staphylococcus chromogenes]MDT0693580.1 MarR family transcriptional regulator [Staphylococcus chromogenes]MDT0701128.1 MarR family transcriptional regulator [Staphylococcus chromogenes]PTF73264.1 MarR family transcriptional regulator [Staphylococcus chromogenes]PTF73370.1 MarR family transcriptional regulator [Staphylococcus chromogenes]PTF76385.1 MarR family transcriptional regulator [Staphylococcus chromogenes]